MDTDTESPATPPAPTTASGPADQEQFDERESAADARQCLADAREDVTGERDRLTGPRESVADPRQHFLDAREIHADRLSRLTEITVPTRRKRSFEAIGRARVLLASSQVRLDRTEATLSHTESGDARERRSAEQEIAASIRRAFGDEMSQQAALESLVGQLQARFRTAAAALAEAQDQLAHHHERLAADGHPDADDHRVRAERARRAARRVRAAVQTRAAEPTTAPPKDDRSAESPALAPDTGT
ncbi:hypothetical protein [Streptomyces paromomycinus]|uniref:Uncharacterized protein n=1 Tax=Streptomyces paromomycinus TaxID=92743 RepID=A0A401VUC4_STREY|nr:hypothetical protein [Streptomyces paromomycinus]GCD40663.1 hypothetical protein GKJPGBOP_00316 [Streptomyces paromomycinus]